MLISEQLQAQVHFTPTDQDLAQVILQDPHAVLGQSMQTLAQRAHCSHSAVIRLCQKLGFKGYRDFSVALTQELSVQKVTPDDVNFPFAPNDTLRNAAEKLTTLSLNAITDTKARLNMPLVVQAVQLLVKAKRIFLYGRGDSSLLVQGFANKLNKIDCYPIFADQFGETSWNSTNITAADCALLVSYRGQNQSYQQVMHYLKAHQVPTIVITGRPQSPVAQLATVCLEVLGDEFDFMKIGTIASQVATEYLLTILFAGVYAHDYESNLDTLKAKQATLTKGPLAESEH